MFWPGHAEVIREWVLLNPTDLPVVLGTEVSIDSTETIDVYSGGGHDDASFRDSPGDDTVTADPSDASLVGPGFHNASHGFSVNHAYSKAGGVDSAQFSDPAAKDYFKADSICSKLVGTGFYNRAKFFEHNTATASGNNDYARLRDSPSDDTLETQRDETRIYNTVWEVTAQGFPQVLVRATEGGDDAAYLTDSDLDDAVRARAHKTQMYDNQTKGDIYKITVRGFEITRACATEGHDTATQAADQYVDLNGDWILNYPVPPITPLLADAVLEPLGSDR